MAENSRPEPAMTAADAHTDTGTDPESVTGSDAGRERAADLTALTTAMIRFNDGDPKRIQHFIKVHRFAQLIGVLEGLDAHTQRILESAALVHDIGIRPAEHKYGYQNGKLQETEGPPHARRMLEQLGWEPADIERICYLVGHHHTYTQIDGIDYQILVEADFLVNLFEDDATPETIRHARDEIFQTASGIRLCNEMFGL